MGILFECCSSILFYPPFACLSMSHLQCLHFVLHVVKPLLSFLDIALLSFFNCLLCQPSFQDVFIFLCAFLFSLCWRQHDKCMSSADPMSSDRDSHVFTNPNCQSSFLHPKIFPCSSRHYLTHLLCGPCKSDQNPLHVPPSLPPHSGPISLPDN